MWEQRIAFHFHSCLGFFFFISVIVVIPYFYVFFRPVKLTPLIIGFENSTGGSDGVVSGVNEKEDISSLDIGGIEGESIDNEDKEQTLAMSRPIFNLISTYSHNDKPTIVFVPGTWQGRQLCVDLLNLANSRQTPFMFLGKGSEDCENSTILIDMMKNVGIETSVLEDEDEDVGNSVPKLFRVLQILLSSEYCFRILSCSPSASDRSHSQRLPENSKLFSNSFFNSSNLQLNSYFKYPSFSSSSTESYFPQVSPFLRNLASTGVGLLHDGLHPVIQVLFRFLFRCGFLRLLVVPHSFCWRLYAERAALIIVASPTIYNSSERRFFLFNVFIILILFL
jgi:hypothetical protein